MAAQKADTPGLKFQLYHPELQLKSGHLPSPRTQFLICKMGLMATSKSELSGEG